MHQGHLSFLQWIILAPTVWNYKMLGGSFALHDLELHILKVSIAKVLIISQKPTEVLQLKEARCNS